MYLAIDARDGFAAPTGLQRLELVNIVRSQRRHLLADHAHHAAGINHRVTADHVHLAVAQHHAITAGADIHAQLVTEVIHANGLAVTAADGGAAGRLRVADAKAQRHYKNYGSNTPHVGFSLKVRADINHLDRP